MALTLLELCDLLQETLMENGMEDLPVYLGDAEIREDHFTVQTVNDSGESFRAVVIKA